MDARELVEHVSQNDQRLAILRALSERPGTPSELADRVSIDRTPVYTAIEGLEQCGGVVSLDGRRKLTAAGHIPVEETLDACEAVGREPIAYLAASTGNKRLRILEGLADSVGRADMLRDDDFPARSTINRTMEDFKTFGWIVDSPQNELTDDGRAVYERYTDLISVVEIAVAKREYLCHVDPLKIDLPINLIADGEVVKSRPNRPTRAIEHTHERMREGFDHAKVFSSYYSKEGVTAMWEAVEDGATWEAVTALPSHIPLPESRTEIRHFRMGLGSDAVAWQIYPDELPMDLIIFDDDRVLLGGDQELESARRGATLDSTNPELIAWVDDLYESHKQQASEPLEYLLDPIRENGLYKALRLDWV